MEAPHRRRWGASPKGSALAATGRGCPELPPPSGSTALPRSNPTLRAFGAAASSPPASSPASPASNKCASSTVCSGPASLPRLERVFGIRAWSLSRGIPPAATARGEVKKRTTRRFSLSQVLMGYRRPPLSWGQLSWNPVKRFVRPRNARLSLSRVGILHPPPKLAYHPQPMDLPRSLYVVAS